MMRAGFSLHGTTMPCHGRSLLGTGPIATEFHAR